MPQPITSNQPPTATAPGRPGRHRIDMRLAPETLSALDKLAADAQLNRTEMMEKLVMEAAGKSAGGSEPVAEKPPAAPKPQKPMPAVIPPHVQQVAKGAGRMKSLR